MKKINSLMQITKRKILSTVKSYIGFKDLKFLLAILHRGHFNFKSISFIVMFIVASLTLLQGCTTYKPVIDTNGRSGTFNEDKARMITDDLQHCKTLAKNNTTFFSNLNFWILSPRAESKYTDIYRKCMNNRGHSVVN